MGLMSGTSGSVTVTANLTHRGKELLHNSIKVFGNLSDTVRAVQAKPLVTKFAFGDSDANYKAIGSGYTLSVNYVPESSSFRPVIRGFCLAKGTYRPGKPVVYVNDDYSQVNTYVMQINQSVPSELVFALRTEWPVNEAFSEAYDVELVPPTNIYKESFEKLFSIEKVGNTVKLKYSADFSSLTDTVTLATLRQSNFSVVITGQITNLSRTISIDVA